MTTGPATGRPPTRTRSAMVATPHSLASSAGLRALRDGGSAVDAAIAANAVLCVAYPHMAGLGGDGFWLIADGDDVRGINASGPAGERATREYYAERGDEDDEIPERGAEAALTVPGAVDGWRLAHEEYGKLPWESLFDEAIDAAAGGVPVTRSLAGWLRTDRDVLAEDDRAGDVFLDGGAAPAAGDLLVQSDLAATLRTLASDGPRDGFYEGAVGRRFCESLAEDGSPLDADDLRAYRAEWVDPLSTTYRGREIYELPPNTQGFAALEILNLLEEFDVAAWGDGTADYYHHLAEAVKLAFADRDAWLSDPEFVDAPLDELLSESYARRRRELIDPDSALPMDVEPGIEPDAPAESVDAGGDTCYLSVVDEDGLVVSMIQSIYFDFGAGVVAGDTGIVPQNRGAFFSLDPDHVNSLEPGKRSFHTLMPGLACRDGEPVLSFGTMGGEGQPQTQAAMLTRLFDFGYDVQQAIEAPRWLVGRTWGAEDRRLSLEGRVSDRVLDELDARGQPVAAAPDWDDTFGHAQAIRIHEDGSLSGGADPRGDGSAVGY